MHILKLRHTRVHIIYFLKLSSIAAMKVSHNVDYFWL